MSTLRSQFSFFLLGLFLAIVIVPILLAFLPKREINSKHISQDNEDQSVQLNKNYRKIRTPRDISLDKISLSIQKGTYLDLSSLRDENLQHLQVSVAVYDNVIKTALLKKLVSLMDAKTWRNWKGSASEVSPRNEIPDAVRFVRDLRTINFKYGRYTETAAYLFSDLFRTSSSGRVFHTEESLYNLVLDATNLFKNRLPKAQSPIMYIDTSISRDRVFLQAIETLRASLVVSYTKRFPRNLETHFLLLGTIRGSHFDDRVLNAYSKLLSTVAENVSPRFREELHASFLRTDAVQDLLGIAPSLKNDVYKVISRVFHDRVSEGNIVEARSIYLQLSAQFPNNSANNSLGERLKSISDNVPEEEIVPEEVAINTQAKSKSTSNIFGTIGERTKSENLVSWIETIGFYIILIGLLALLVTKLGFTTYLKNILLKTLDSSKKSDLEEELDRSIRAGKTVPLTSPSKQTNDNYPDSNDDQSSRKYAS